MKGIPLYSNINDLHQLTGSALQTHNPLFHCFDMEEANDLKVETLPPHRVDFYTLAINSGTQQLSYTLNQKDFKEPQRFMLCVAPGQVVSWRKKGQWQGYCTFFKAEFLQFNSSVNFLQQYPFFNLNESNLLNISLSEFDALQPYFTQIIQEQVRQDPFSREIIRASFQAILWMCRRIYEGDKPSPSQKAGAIIAAQFQYLVNEHFLSKITVEQYAQMLNITANHLSQTIVDVCGKSAKSIISSRRVNEAKYLLVYTDNGISEIAFHLGFIEPTHFSKFFKKETTQTPQEYRQQNKR